jgi:WD40 repeat protein
MPRDYPALYFSPDSSVLTSSFDGVSEVWSLRDGTFEKTLKGAPEKFLQMFSSDGRSIVSQEQLFPVNSWQRAFLSLSEKDMVTTTYAPTYPFEEIESAALSPDKKYLAWGYQDGKIEISLKKQRREIRKSIFLKAPRKQFLGGFLSVSNKVNSLSISPDSRFVAAGYDDSNITIWDLKTRKVQNLEGHRKSVYSVSFSADGAYLVSGGWDGKIRVWKAQETAPPLQQ